MLKSGARWFLQVKVIRLTLPQEVLCLLYFFMACDLQFITLLSPQTREKKEKVKIKTENLLNCHQFTLNLRPSSFSAKNLQPSAYKTSPVTTYNLQPQELKMPSPRSAAAKARKSISSSFEEEVGIIFCRLTFFYGCYRHFSPKTDWIRISLIPTFSESLFCFSNP